MSTVASMPVNTYRDYLRGKPVCLWSGPSALDPSRRVAAVLSYTTTNRKTGPVHNLAIYDLSAQTGEPTGAGCGKCPLHAAGVCYVETAFYDVGHHNKVAGGSSALPVVPRRYWHNFLSRFIRFGSYGDPAALPLKVIEAISALTPGHAGYTHFWGSCDQSLSRFLMASCETFEQAEQARSMGWRPFLAVQIGTNKIRKTQVERVTRSIRADLGKRGLKNAVVCPGYAKDGVVQCLSCPVGCDGSRGKPLMVVNPVHGVRGSSHPGDVVPLLPIVE